MDLTCSLIYLAIFLLILIIEFFILQLLFRRTRLITVFFGILLLSNLTLLAINNWFGDIFNVVIDQNNNLTVNVDLLLYCTKNVLTIISLPITLFHTLFTSVILNIFSTFMEDIQIVYDILSWNNYYMLVFYLVMFVLCLILFRKKKKRKSLANSRYDD